MPTSGQPERGGAGRPGIASFRPRWPGATAAGTGQSSAAGPGIASRPDPAAGIGSDTVRISGGATGPVPGHAARRSSCGRRHPGPGRRQTVRAGRRATASARRPGHWAWGGHAIRRLIGPERQVVPSRHHRCCHRPDAHSCRCEVHSVVVTRDAPTAARTWGRADRRIRALRLTVAIAAVAAHISSSGSCNLEPTGGVCQHYGPGSRTPLLSPVLFAELVRRSWSRDGRVRLADGNIPRVLR
jgi:hypothetical protein